MGIKTEAIHKKYLLFYNMNLEEKLRELLKNGQVIPVVGAGVSYATAGLPGWKGLIEDGLDYAERNKFTQSIIDEARTLLTSDKLIQAASHVKQLLNAPDHPFTNWLNDALGRPKVNSPLLIESIQNLCQPVIATTNYDDLLRSVGSVQTDLALDWSQHEEIQSCLDNRKQFILHLHGIYTRPHTPIFGEDDYENLKTQKGYKTILSDLWRNRHFLFIGCSRDGVMDEDFSTVLQLMHNWFPGIQKEHFILLRESEIGSAMHQQLIKECNVHGISFGKNYDDLPSFINKINPNAEELVVRFEQRKLQAYNGIKAILEAQPKLDIPARIGQFINENLGSPYYWIENNRLEIFEEALRDYNQQINSKQQQFLNIQLVTRALINVTDLQKKIDLWAENRSDISPINNLDFINTAILAYRCLEKIPKEILEDIRLKQSQIIYHTFFSGELKGFIGEANRWKDRSGPLSHFANDKYFFENLVRIMRSLLQVLILEPKELYSEKDLAKIASEFPAEALLFVAEKAITLRESAAPYEILAALPWSDSFPFINAGIVETKDAKIVVGFNAQQCFKWDPLSELLSTNFYAARRGEHITDCKVVSQGDNVVIEVYTTKSCITIVNFAESVVTKLAPGFSQYLRLNTGKKYCRYTVYIGNRSNCVFEFNALEDYTPILSTIDLWNHVKHIPEIKENFDKFKIEEGFDNEEENHDYPYIQDVTLGSVKWARKEVLVVRFRLSLLGPDSVILLFFDPADSFETPKLKMIFLNKNCFSYDTIVVDDHVNFIAGYLDFNKVGNLIQFFENIDSERVIVAGDQPGIIPQNRLASFKVRDMFRVNFAKAKRAFVIEEGKILHDIKLPELTDTETPISDGIKSLYYSDHTI